jgi:hypothetical protein
MAGPDDRPFRRVRSIRAVAVVLAMFSPGGAAAAPPALPDPAYATAGYWEAPFDWITTGTHVCLIPGTDTHSQVLYWYDGTTVRVWSWNPGDWLHAGSNILHRPCPSTDIHCSGHSLLASGQVLVTGGNDLGPNGQEDLNRWDPVAKGWINEPTTLIEPRWYPTQTTLGDGRILVTSGIRSRELVAFGGSDDAAPRSGLVVAGLRGVDIDPWVLSAASGGSPPAREGHVAVFDRTFGTNAPGTSFPYLQRVIVHGGTDAGGGALGDVWALTRTELSAWTWTPLSPAGDPVSGSPTPRRDHAAFFNAPDSSLVLVGGRDGAGNPLDEVWKLYLYRGSQGRWQRLAPTGGDASLARWNAAAAFDPAGQRLFLVGGRNAGGLLGDVWRLTTGASPTWTKLAPVGTPPTPREGSFAAYDPPGANLVVYGGRSAGQLEEDVRVLNLAGTPAWSAMTPTPDPVAGTPGARWRGAGIHDNEQRRLVLFGGDTTFGEGAGAAGDLWHLDFRGTPSWKRHQAVHPDGPRIGAAAVLDTRYMNSVLPEIIDPATLAASPLPMARRWQNIYPAMFLLPSGRLIDAAPAFQSLLLDVTTGTWSTPSWSISGSLTFNGVMYRPGKILACGGSGSVGTSAARWIDLATSEAGPGWQPVGGLVPRTVHNLVVVPYGDVYVMGGVGSRSLWSTAVRRPQRWTPGSPAFGDTLSLAPDPAVRDYHSSITLLPDGRLLSAGGDLRPTPTDRNKYTATIWWPPYLFADDGSLAPRPVITAAPPVLGYGHAFVVESPDAADIATLCLIRPASTTHGFDQEQRYVPLAFTMTGAGMLEAVSPESPNHAPPGWYLLFAVDGDSVPSVAQWVRLDAAVSGVPDARRPVQLVAAPNPSGGDVSLTFRMAAPGAVRIEIIDVLGRCVRRLYDGVRPAGHQSLSWDGRDDAGRRLAAGSYHARMTCPAGTGSVRLVRVR